MRVLALALALVREEPVNTTGTNFTERNGYGRYENPDITEKYDGWEMVIKTLFTVGCTAKHSTDIIGQAKHNWNATNGSDMDAYIGEIRKVQTSNAADMTGSCGAIPARGMPACRMNCQHSWGDQMVPRDACDTKCEQKYRQFEAECHNKVESLRNVYNVEIGKLDAYASCAELHCPDFPVTTNCTEDDLADLDDCKASMVTDMQKNVTVEYCDALFEWIYEAEARDPATGDPIVFLDVGQAAPEPAGFYCECEGKPNCGCSGRTPQATSADPAPDCECTKDHEHGPDCGCSGRAPIAVVRKAFLEGKVGRIHV